MDTPPKFSAFITDMYSKETTCDFNTYHIDLNSNQKTKAERGKETENNKHYTKKCDQNT